MKTAVNGIGGPGVMPPFALGLSAPLSGGYGGGIPSLGAFALASTGALGSATPTLRGLSNVVLVSNLNEEVCTLVIFRPRRLLFVPFFLFFFYRFVYFFFFHSEVFIFILCVTNIQIIYFHLTISVFYYFNFNFPPILISVLCPPFFFCSRYKNKRRLNLKFEE